MNGNTRWLVIGGILAAVVAGMFDLRARNMPEPPPPVPPTQSTGVIQQPKSGETVERIFIVMGSLRDMSQGYHVWLGFQIDTLIWPKEPEIPATDRRFSVKILEGGNPPEGSFSLTLFQVSPEGQKRIAHWLDTGRKTGHWPGLDRSEIDGFSQLDRADNLKLR